MAFFILIISVFVFFIANDNFSHSEVDDDGEDDGDDDGEDVNQETKQEQVEAEVGPFWGIR